MMVMSFFDLQTQNSRNQPQSGSHFILPRVDESVMSGRGPRVGDIVNLRKIYSLLPPRDQHQLYEFLNEINPVRGQLNLRERNTEFTN